MNKKEFLNFVAQGYHRIPVSKTLEGFNVDPINIYEKISEINGNLKTLEAKLEGKNII